jgi:uncharacterized protein
MLRRIKRYIRYEYLLFMRLRGNPKQIAKGVAMGASINFLPTVGLGVFLAYFLASAFRINRTATILSTMAVKAGVPIYYALDIVVGDFLLGRYNEGLWALVEKPFTRDMVIQIGLSFLLGSVVNTLLAGMVAYYVVLNGIMGYRNKRARCRNSL